LSIFNITIVISAISTMAIGTAVWFFTLRQRADFETVWKKHDSSVKDFLQDSLQCCGYWNATAAGLFQASTTTTGFCAIQAVSNLPHLRSILSLLIENACLTAERHFSNTLRNAHHGILRQHPQQCL
jgi:hypothetical protein